MQAMDLIPDSRVQHISLGDAHVDSHRPVILSLGSSPLAVHEAARTHATLHWTAPDGAVRILAVSGYTVPLPVIPHASGVYRYWVEWRETAGRWTLRAPGGKGTYRLEADASREPTVVDVSGHLDATHGEPIPIAVRLSSPASVHGVTLHHWTDRATHVSSTAMDLDDPRASTGTWRAAIPAPGYGVKQVEYYITIELKAGPPARCGGLSAPFRVRVQPGPLPPERR